MTQNLPPQKTLSQTAIRALEEAESRRAIQQQKEQTLNNITEKGGRNGLDPVRYNDWEKKGIAVDF